MFINNPIIKLTRHDISTLVVPNFQRPIDYTNVDNMVQHIIQRISKGKSPILGVIDIAEIQGPFGSFRYIVDGQHRFEAIKKFYSISSTELDIYAMLYQCSDMTEAQELFQLRNLNTMVPDYLIKPNDKSFLYREIQEYLLTIKGFVSKTTKRPYIDVTLFMNKLINSRWIQSVNTLIEFRDKIGNQNQILSNHLLDQRFIARQNISDSMIKNWRDWGVFLCVDQHFLWLSQ